MVHKISKLEGQSGHGTALQQKPTAYPRISIDRHGSEPKVVIETERPEQILDVFSAATFEVADGLAFQLINAKSGKKVEAHEANFALQAVREIAPRDPLEALLASQMVAVHCATMAAARRLGGAENIAQHDTNLNALTKLARTFAAQLTALKQYRATGAQTVTVMHQHVTIADGGQAIVGDVHHGGGRGVPEKGEATS